MALLTGILTVLSGIWEKNPTFYAGILGALIAWSSIRNQKRTSKEKNSLDFEAAYKRNEKVVEAWSEVLRIYKDRAAVPLADWGKPENAQTEGAKALKLIFNEWERCANAVHNNLYDNDYLYKVYGSTLIFLDVHFEPYMAECRKKNPRFYRNMKILALQWRVKRSYEDTEGDTKKYQRNLKLAIKCINRLKVRF
ncbi:DUF4760 domain-containing protein [Hafnia paralvei]|uniref:DUF4760 domain-containing protein n=1 Tax=Hafnia paralvei TaxID=546367 RepID=UPI00163C2719|nr:DUF4760 domain-containing protein [Hafnia paralvei]